jgi:hypothetical protein
VTASDRTTRWSDSGPTRERLSTERRQPLSDPPAPPQQEDVREQAEEAGREVVERDQQVRDGSRGEPSR